jgi:hypothetical protein
MQDIDERDDHTQASSPTGRLHFAPQIAPRRSYRVEPQATVELLGQFPTVPLTLGEDSTHWETALISDSREGCQRQAKLTRSRRVR